MGDTDIKMEVPKRIYVAADVDQLKQNGSYKQAAKLRLKIIKRAKLPDAETKKTMREEGNDRMKLIKTMNGFSKNPDNYTTTSSAAEHKWVETVKANNALAAYGMDEKGIAARQKASRHWRITGSGGRFSPFIVANGILRGGMTGHMREEGNGAASIPTEVGGRALMSCRGKYTHPLKYPASRIVKFMRSTWGNPRVLNKFEQL